MSVQELWQNLVLLIDRLSPDDPLDPRPVYRNSRYPRRQNYDGTGDYSSSSDDEPVGYEPPTYEALTQDGARLDQEMQNPNVRTPVRRNTWTLDDLEIASDAWDISIERTPNLASCFTWRNVAGLRLPDGNYTKITIDLWNHETETHLGTAWVGRAKEGVLSIENIRRAGFGPYSSELGIMVYERVAPLDTLRTIFIANVMNNETRYPSRSIWRGPETRVFPQGHPDFHALLGTGIGKVVAYTILGAFGQGVKKVSDIMLWYTGHRQDILQMRFDIEDV